MPFVRAKRGGKLLVELDAPEAGALRHLADEMIGLLEEESRADPVVRRLFPDAYEDPQDARDFASLVGDELRATKRQSLERLRSHLGRAGGARVSLAPDDVQAWLTTLTDLRLAIGARLEITQEGMDAPVDSEHPDAMTMAILHWLGWLQESILETMDH